MKSLFFRSPVNHLLFGLLWLKATLFNQRRELNRYLAGVDGWINFSVGIRTESGSVNSAISYNNGSVRAHWRIQKTPDLLLIVRSGIDLIRLISGTPTEQIYMLLNNKIRTVGNLSYLNLFFFYVSLLMHKRQIALMKKECNRDMHKLKSKKFPVPDVTSTELNNQFTSVAVLNDDKKGGNSTINTINSYTLGDFPRIRKFLEIHFNEKPEICPERAVLMTRWFRENGFEKKNNGTPWNPILRQSLCFKEFMCKRKPVVRRNDLIAGTTTSKEIGVVIYPDSHGLMIWGELLTVPFRTLNPYTISAETIDLLHNEVFPFWIHRNFREWVRREHGAPLCQQIDERFAVYFSWKQSAISHTIPDFPKLLKSGTTGIKNEISQQLAKINCESDPERQITLHSMINCLDGVEMYAENLACQLRNETVAEIDPIRKEELTTLADICAKVPKFPAETFDEAINAIWICWVSLHMENTNAGLSFGRLDQVLQPYYEHDITLCKSKTERVEYVKHVVELCCCLFLRATDHLPLIPDIANHLFGGSSSNQAVTLGGVKPDGSDGVNDLTYILLKVTEMLSIRDPNVNARFNAEVNSEHYLRRICEVNYHTAATPSIHNDTIVAASLKQFRYPEECVNDWSATGCVEPTLSGKHFGHTNFQMMNMVAPLEMAMNNGKHPLMNWQVGPETGVVENGDFTNFNTFFEAFKKQFTFLIEQSIEYNELLGAAHQLIRPTPLLSSMIDGCITAARDVTQGGALFNSSGGACIGLADVTDSLLAIKKHIFDDHTIDFKELKKAVEVNFKGYKKLHALLQHKTPKFGSGNQNAVDLANRITEFTHSVYKNHRNYRGGPYTVGFWSMSSHVAYGILTGALPSGRLVGKPFTPGLTPSQFASVNIMDNIRAVASLKPEHMNNNIAFNVKISPGMKKDMTNVINAMYSYVRTFFSMGGMQMQMNVVTSAMLKDAMEHPENYRNLLVRISGYNAYFVTLNRDMQLELISRAEY